MGRTENQLLSVLTGSPDSSSCTGLATAFDVAQGTLDAEAGLHIPGLGYIPDTVPGSLQFASNGALPSVGPGIAQTQIYSVQDGSNSWAFYNDQPVVVRRPPVLPRRIPH